MLKISLICVAVTSAARYTALQNHVRLVLLLFVFVCFSVVVVCFLFVVVVVVFLCVCFCCCCCCCCCCFFLGGGAGRGVALLYNLVKGTCVCLFCHNNCFKILTAKQITTLSCHPRSNKNYCL